MAGGDDDTGSSDGSLPPLEPISAPGDGDSDGGSSHDSMPELEAADFADTASPGGEGGAASCDAEARLDAALEAAGRGMRTAPPSRAPLGAIQDNENDDDDDGDGSSSHCSMPELEPMEKEEGGKGPTDGTFMRDTTLGCVNGRMPMDDFKNRRLGLPPDIPEPEYDGPNPDSSDWFGQSRKNDYKHGFKKPHISDEELEKLYDYPKWTEEQRDPEWWQDEWKRMATDPRHNKNLNRDPNDPEYWNEAARLPWAKTMMRKEQHWNDRRNLWTRQWEKVNQMNLSRGEVCDLLEDCSSEVKRLVTPMLKYKVVETLLYQVNQEAKKKGIAFKDHVQQPKNLANLHEARKRIDQGGDVEGKRLCDEMDFLHKVHSTAYLEQKKKEETDRGRLVIDMEGLKTALDFGQKCKKDGLIEWQMGHWEEAIASWRQGDDALKRYRAPWQNVKENTMLAELHSAVLKNLAQAAIKLEYWNEALEAADKVVEMNPEDHKAWFRRACALEGLGKIDESAACLDRIETIAVGRPDRERIDKDIQTRRERIVVLKERDKEANQRMFQGSLQKGFFSSDRKEKLQAPKKPPSKYVSSSAAKDAAKALIAEDLKPEAVNEPRGRSPSPAKKRSTSATPKVKRGLKPGETPAQRKKIEEQKMRERESLEGHIDKLGGHPPAKPAERARRRLTQDGAEDVLNDLDQAYQDPWFIERVDKLVQDMNHDPDWFMAHIGRVALDVQRPILEKWGFDVSSQGVRDMSLAIQEHTRGRDADPALKARADEVGKGLYGSPDLGMFKRVHGA